MQKNTNCVGDIFCVPFKVLLLLFVLAFSNSSYGQGTWTKLATNAPTPNMGVMLLLTDGTVICHNSNGGTYGTGWNKLTPNINGSYVNGTWSTIASMTNDRLFFSSQVLPSGKVFVAGGEYGPGGGHGEVYDPVANTWTATGDPPSGYNFYDANSEILPNGTVLEGPQITPTNASYECELYTPSTNLFTTAPASLYNHDEAQWLKLPDNSILFVGIASTSSNRYIPATNTWVNDGTVPVNLYDNFGEEAGSAYMLPNGKAIFFGATGQNAYYTPSGNTSPGTWSVAPSFPTIGGTQLGTADAAAAMMVNGKILCALSFIGESVSDEFRTPTYFFEFDYTTNTFTQVTSKFPGLNADSLAGVGCFQTCFLDLPDGTVLLGIGQTGTNSKIYYDYTPSGTALAAGKPTITGISTAACPTYSIYGTGFNGITEGAAYGDDWQMETNYPIVRLTKGTSVYYAKTVNWNRIGAVQTGALADTVQFTMPAGLPNGTYSLVVVANGNASSAITVTTPCTTCSSLTVNTSSTGVKCNGGSTGSATATPSGGTAPYTYAWTPSGGSAATASNLSAGTYTVTATDVNGCKGTASVNITQPTALGVTTGSIVNVKCKGSSTGSAKATPTGGTSPYTYAWAPSGGSGATASNLSAGTYTITVTDAKACMATASAVITQPATALGVTTGSIVEVGCKGAATGAATATPTNGTTPYTYAWTPSGGSAATASNLTAGTYTITVKDANACAATASAIITQPAIALAVTTGSIVNENCNGGATGSATATPTNGTTPYTYAWTPSGGSAATASSLAAGTYTVTVKDANGCSATAKATITQPTALAVSTGSIVNVKCNGASTGSAKATPTGGTPSYTFAWTPSGGTGSTASNLSAGTYTITITDAKGCSTSASAVITQPTTALAVTTGSIVNVNCKGAATGSATASPTGGTGAYTYAWTPSGGSAATASNLSAGTYTITVKDANACSATASAIITQPAIGLTVTTGSIVNEPCNGGATGSATATPANGTSPYTYAWTPSGGSAATASGLTAGSYTITVTDAGSCSATAKAVITQPVVLAVSTTFTPVKCNGGSTGTATAHPTGGTSPYTYAWTPSGGSAVTASGLSTGTYTVTVTDAHSCSASANVVVTQPATLAATTTVVNIVCKGSNTGSATANPTGGTSPYTYAWTPSGGSAATASNLSAGSYTVTVKDANACSASASAVITQPATALGVTTSTTPAFCNTNSGSATATPSGGTPAYTYAWSPSGGNAATANNLSAGTYTITLTDANACVATATAIVTQPAPVVATISSSTNITCNGGSNGSATVSGSNGTPPYTYAWTPSGGNAATASGLTAGTYTVTITDAASCSGSTSVTLTQPPALAITPSAPSICEGGSVSLLASNAASYTWLPATNLTCTACPSPTASPTTSTTYTVTGVSGVCTYTASVLVTVNSIPSLSIVPPAPNLCSGDSLTLRAFGATSYTWAPAANLSATSAVVVTAFPPTTATYTVTGTTSGCSSTQQVTITVGQTPTVTVSPSSSICSGGNVILSAGGATTYTWGPAAGLSATAGSPVTASPTVTTSYTVAGTTGLCSDTAAIMISVTPTPTVIVTPSSASVCSGGTGATLTASGGTTYTWAPAAGLSATTGSTVTATPTATTTYTVTGTTGTCNSTATVVVTVNTTPTVSVNFPTSSICSNGNEILTASGGTTYTWAPATGLSATTGNSVTANPTTTTVYTITGTTGLCSAIATASVNVTTVPTVTVNPVTATLCSGTGTVLSAGGATTYTWSPSTGLSATTGSAVTATPTTSTTYTVTGTTGTCNATATSGITVNATPTVTVSPSSAICSGNNTILNAGGATTYAWAPNTGLSATTGASVTATPNNTVTYTVTGTTGSCSANKVVTVTVNSMPDVTITPNSATICNGGSGTTLTAGGAITYNWAPSIGLSTTTGINVTANPTVPTTYTVTGQTAAGCSNTATAIVGVDPAVTANITVTKNTICKGDSTTLIASGGGTYKWNTNATTAKIAVYPPSTATYNVTVTSLICSDVASASITVNDPPSPSISKSGDTLKCTPTGLTSYQWYKNGALLTSSTFDTIHFTPGAATYKVLATNSFGCFDSAFYTTKTVTGINEVSFDDQILIYPNPTNGNLHIECSIPEDDYVILLTDVLGQSLYTSKLHIYSTYSGNINMSGYSPGIYILTIKSNSSFTEKKVMLIK